MKIFQRAKDCFWVLFYLLGAGLKKLTLHFIINPQGRSTTAHLTAHFTAFHIPLLLVSFRAKQAPSQPLTSHLTPHHSIPSMQCKCNPLVWSSSAHSVDSPRLLTPVVPSCRIDLISHFFFSSIDLTILFPFQTNTSRTLTD